MCTLTLNTGNKIRCTLITSTNLINIWNYFFYVINILLPGEIMSWMKYVYILVLQFKGIQLKKGNCIKLFYINPLSQKCCVLTAISNSAWKMKNFKVCIVKSSTALQQHFIISFCCYWFANRLSCDGMHFEHIQFTKLEPWLCSLRNKVMVTLL